MKRFLIFALIYAVLYIWGEQKANFFLALICILFIPFVMFSRVLKNKLYKYSIKFVPHVYVFNSNTINNQYCSIRYTPDEKIVVMENIKSTNSGELRTFTLTRFEVKDINKCWYEACKLFDEYTYFDLLVSFWSRYGYNIHINSVENKNYKNKKSKSTIGNQKIIEQPRTLENILEPNKNYKETTNKGITEKAIAGVEDTEFVDMEQLISYKNMGSQLDKSYSNDNGKKININIATAQELATLPGINIVGAKKAVAFRNKNRSFNSIEEFFDVVGVKDFFKSKICSMIDLKPPESSGFNNNREDSGRIVDL